MPAGQLSHDETEIAPIVDEKDPDGQEAQDVDELEELKVPAAQVEHEAAPSEAYMPGMQDAQFASNIEPVDPEAVPAGHSEQTDELAAVEYEPTAQVEHKTSDVWYEPAGQILEQNNAAGVLKLPDGQFTQLVAPSFD